MRVQATGWVKLLTNHASEKGHVSRIHKEPSELNRKKVNNLLFNRQLTKRAEDGRRANKHEKMLSSAVLKET